MILEESSQIELRWRRAREIPFFHHDEPPASEHAFTCVTTISREPMFMDLMAPYNSEQQRSGYVLCARVDRNRVFKFPRRPRRPAGRTMKRKSQFSFLKCHNKHHFLSTLSSVFYCFLYHSQAREIYIARFPEIPKSSWRTS